MKYPSCFYSKAFWILLPIIITAGGSAYAAIDAEINSLDERLRATENQVAENNVPDLKKHIDKRFDRLEEHSMENYRLLCKISEGNC